MSTTNIRPETFAATTFDYIIVGGGTAGLVVAARLTEDPSVTVGVIEAGESHANADGINIPGLSGTTIGDPRYDWSFMSAPQKYANNRPIFTPRGKGLGGSSMINLLGFGRASAHEYDGIEALGNPGWNWNEFLKYMKKSETTLPIPSDSAAKHDLVKPDPQWHGDSGPLVKSYPNNYAALHFPFIKTLENVGIRRNPQPDNGVAIGSTSIFTSVDHRTATRSYSARSYYEPNASRKNLTVITSSVVSRVVFRPGSGPLVATGVEFLNDGKKYIVSARREVILSAGSYQSPQVLELSGIGNKEILSKYGIKTLIDLPSVGENLQDHPFVPTIHEIDPKYDTVDNAQEPEYAARQQELYKTQQGFLSSAVAALYVFFPTTVFATEEQLKKWKALGEESVRNAPPGLKKQLELQLKWLSDPTSGECEVIPFPGLFAPTGVQPKPGSRYSSMLCILMHPFSRGSVHISSADPVAPPAIDHNYLSNPLDVELLRALVKFSIKIYGTDPVKDSVLGRVVPTAEESLSDEALIEYVKNGLGPVFHPLGSASMLPKEDGGVVDPQLKVYGTANLRVVDASILPIELGAHIQATVYGIAEKAADIIKQNQV